MAGPITWRSVVGPQLSDAAVPLQASQRSFENMFGSLQRVLNERNQFAEQQAGAVREGNRQAFLDALQGARTPEELQALQASGSLDQLQAALTPEARASVRGAFDARLAGLRQQTVADQAYGDAQRDRAEAPIREMIGSLLARGENKAVRQLLDTQDLRTEIPFEAAIVAARDKEIQKAREAEEYEERRRKARTAEEQARIAMDRDRASIRASNLQADMTTRQMNEYTESQHIRDKERAQAAAAARAASELAYLKETGNVYADGVYNPNNSQELMEMMTKADIGGNADARAKILQKLAQTGGEWEVESRGLTGKLEKSRIPIPLSLVKQAILSTNTNNDWFWTTDNEWANRFEENLKKAMTQVVDVPMAPGVTRPDNRASFDLSRYIQVRSQAANNPQIPPPKK